VGSLSISKTALKNIKQNFLGEVVVLYLKQNVAIPGPDGEIHDIRAMLQGLVVDVDQDYLYVDNKAIRHDDYGIIELANFEFDSLLDESMPVDEREIN
jgi:hypothetical protein